MVCARCKQLLLRRRQTSAFAGGRGWHWRQRAPRLVRRSAITHTTLTGHLELGAATLTKAVWWGMRLASLLTYSFLCCLLLFVLALVSSMLRQETGWEKCVRNEPLCVEWQVSSELSHSPPQADSLLVINCCRSIHIVYTAECTVPFAAKSLHNSQLWATMTSSVTATLCELRSSRTVRMSVICIQCTKAYQIQQTAFIGMMCLTNGGQEIYIPLAAPLQRFLFLVPCVHSLPASLFFPKCSPPCGQSWVHLFQSKCHNSNNDKFRK